jgi:hypothetical protein
VVIEGNFELAASLKPTLVANGLKVANVPPGSRASRRVAIDGRGSQPKPVASSRGA